MPEDAKALVRRFYTEVSAGNLAVVDEVLSQDFIDHEVFPGMTPDKAGAKQFFTMFHAAFPDMRMEAEDMVQEGELLCVRGKMTGTQRGEFMGMPATGRHIDIEGFDMLRIRDGQITEHWGLMDSMTMMQQLGAIPEQAPA